MCEQMIANVIIISSFNYNIWWNKLKNIWWNKLKNDGY